MNGYVKLEINGSSPERFLNMCVHHKLEIWNLISKEETFCFYMSKKDFKKLRPLIRKSKIKLKIIEKHGFPFFIFQNRKRKWMLGIIAFIIVLKILLPKYIWNIEVSGNTYYTNESIITYLNENNIQKSTAISQIDCDQIESLLREEFYYIIWTTAYVDGTNLVINIKENEQITSFTTIETIGDVNYGTDIIASENGVIESIITRSGTSLVHVGDIVEKGDVLVTGCLEVMGDYDLLLGYKYVESDADIMIATTYSYSNTLELIYLKKNYIDTSQRSFYIKCASYYVLIGLKKQLEPYYDSVELEWTISPDQQQIFEFSVGVITDNAYEFIEMEYSDNELREILTNDFLSYCEELIEKKVEIIQNDVKIYIDEKNAVAQGDIQVLVPCTETCDTAIIEWVEDTEQEGIDE